MKAKEILELKETIQELFKLFDENVLVRNTDYDHDFIQFTKDGIRITNVLVKLQDFVDKH